MGRKLLGVFLLVGSLMGVCAQESPNPFDLTFRLPAGSLASTSNSSTDVVAVTPGTGNDNPFELRKRPMPKSKRPTVAPAARKPWFSLPKPSPGKDSAKARQHIQFLVVAVIFVLLAFLMTLLRSVVGRTYQAFLNENLLNQLFREQEGRGIWPFLLLYLLFLFNGGSFVYFAIQYWKVATPFSPWSLFGLCLLGVTLLVLAKHIVLAIIGFIFPVEKEESRYQFLIIVFGIILGLFLAPVNILLAYGPNNLHAYLIQGGLGGVALVYLFRILRSILIANRFIAAHKFHFLLYICSVEVAPIMVLYKLILN
ncbi:MAG: DUF4271 domain-containing protein [Lewinellaceae bacterium]|nr:DUF4271 domain-containing protein [Lewinellaceae bacterium]